MNFWCWLNNILADKGNISKSYLTLNILEENRTLNLQMELLLNAAFTGNFIGILAVSPPEISVYGHWPLRALNYPLVAPLQLCFYVIWMCCVCNCLLCNLFFHFTLRELHRCCSDLSHHGLEKAPADEIFIEQMKHERSFIIPQRVASARTDIILSRPTKSRSDVLIAEGTYSVWGGIFHMPGIWTTRTTWLRCCFG